MLNSGEKSCLYQMTTKFGDRHASYWQLNFKKAQWLFWLFCHSLIDRTVSTNRINEQSNILSMQLTDTMWEDLISIWPEATFSLTVGLIFFGPLISHCAYPPHCTICQCSPLRVSEVENYIPAANNLVLNCPQSIGFAVSTFSGAAAEEQVRAPPYET